LRVGAVGAFGLSLPRVLEIQAQAAARGKPVKDVNCILLWMMGGPSHHDTFDPKPLAGDNVRGEFRSKPTALPGVRFTEHVPKLAAAASHFALLRSLNPRNNTHGVAEAYMMSGHPYTPAMVYPCYGSVVAQQKGYRDGMPPFVQVGTHILGLAGGGTAGFLGNAMNPFVIPSDPSAPGFSARDVTPPDGVPLGRVERRLDMLRSLDRWQAHMERSDLVSSLDTFYQKAHALITAPQTKNAFDLRRESDRVRDGYGRTKLGQSCLLARRLVEAGVRFVTVTDGGWDTHAKNFTTLKEKKLPPLDQALPFLIRDLAARGLLESTLVVWMGDFGRTPQINPDAGRDHWGSVGNVIFAGGGTRAGVVVGATDREGANPVSQQYYTEDVAATLYGRLGIPLDAEFMTQDGRPVHPWVGKPLAEII
jgi:hypothetical protein